MKTTDDKTYEIIYHANACPDHPTYNGLREPRTDCKRCAKLRKAVLKAEIKEVRTVFSDPHDD